MRNNDDNKRVSEQRQSHLSVETLPLTAVTTHRAKQFRVHFN